MGATREQSPSTSTPAAAADAAAERELERKNLVWGLALFALFLLLLAATVLVSFVYLALAS